MASKWLVVGGVMLLGAGAIYALEVANDARESDLVGDFATKVASAQHDFESCLFGGRRSDAWGAGAAEGLLGNVDLWRTCVDELSKAADLAHQDSGSSVAAVERYRSVLREHLYDLPLDRHHPKHVCLGAATLRDALMALEQAADKDVQALERPMCDPTLNSVQSVPGAFDEDESVTIWRVEPNVVGRFYRNDGEHAYAQYQDGGWNILPTPAEAIDGSFEPTGPSAILRGSPQTVVRYEQGEWEEVGVGPNEAVLRHLRATREQGLIAVAEDSKAGQFYALRSASLVGPFDAPIAMATPVLAQGHECAPPVLQTDGAIVVACSFPSQGDHQLVVLRLAASEAHAKQITIATGDTGAPDIVACQDPRHLWIRWGSPAAAETRIFGSNDGGETFVDAGTLPQGGAAMCRNDELLWLGINTSGETQVASCGLRAGSCAAATKMGGDEVWRSLDGEILALAANGVGFAALFDLRGAGPLHAYAYSLMPTRNIGLRNLRQLGAQLFERVEH